MNHEESIEKTKQGFEASFRADSYYNIQTQDKNHLETIVNSLQIEVGMKIIMMYLGLLMSICR